MPRRRAEATLPLPGPPLCSLTMGGGGAAGGGSPETQGLPAKAGTPWAPQPQCMVFPGARGPRPGLQEMVTA